MTWAGLEWCPECKQLVDVESDDGKEYSCVHCGHKFEGEKI